MIKDFWSSIKIGFYCQIKWTQQESFIGCRYFLITSVNEILSVFGWTWNVDLSDPGTVPINVLAMSQTRRTHVKEVLVYPKHDF